MKVEQIGPFTAIQHKDKPPKLITKRVVEAAYKPDKTKKGKYYDNSRLEVPRVWQRTKNR